MSGFVCDRCQTTWDEGEARCPKCLRKTSVRSTERSSSEAVRIARGDHSQTDGARRMTALVTALAATIAVSIGLSWVWETLCAFSLHVPSLFACVVASVCWLGAALVTPSSWAVFARRFVLACVAAIWAFACGAIALASAGDLSPPFTVGLALISFAAGVISVAGWMRPRTDEPEPPSGKWR